MSAQDLKIQLGEYMRDPLVSVIVDNFSGTFSQTEAVDLAKGLAGRG